MERSHDTRGFYVKLPGQRDGNPAVAFPGNQIHLDHGVAFLLQQQGRVWTWQLIRQRSPRHYAE